MSESKIQEEVVSSYALKEGLDLTEARKRLESNYKKEVEQVDAKEIALKCLKAIRSISPKVTGMEMREQDSILKIRGLEGTVRGLKNRLDAQETTFRKTIELIIEQSKPKESFLKCYWMKLKNYLLKK